MTDLSELRKLAEGATPGKWEALSDTPTNPRSRVGVVLPSLMGAEQCGYDSHCIAITHANDPRIDADANGRYIAACSPDRILKLLDVVDSARAMEAARGFTCDCGIPSADWDDIRTALAALEKDQ